MPDTPMPMNVSGTSRPIPDPTDLTRIAVDQARQLSNDYTDGHIAVLEQRLAGMDEATRVLNETVTRVPTDVQKEVGHLREVMEGEVGVIDEKFLSVDKQFAERDIRTQQQQDASAQALAAALQAAKELVGAQGEASAAAAVKSETSFTKQIDQIGTIIQTLEKALDARLTELKERIDRGEGTSQGQNMTKTESRANVGIILAAISAGFVLMSLILGIIIFVSNKP